MQYCALCKEPMRLDKWVGDDKVNIDCTGCGYDLEVHVETLDTEFREKYNI